jgi:hypothetical protein
MGDLLRTALLYVVLASPMLVIIAGILFAVWVGHVAVRKGRGRRWYVYGAVLAAALVIGALILLGHLIGYPYGS